MFCFAVLLQTHTEQSLPTSINNNLKNNLHVGALSRTYKSHLTCFRISLVLTSASGELLARSTRRPADLDLSPSQRPRDAAAAAPAGPGQGPLRPRDQTGRSASRGRADPPIGSGRSGPRSRSHRGHRPGPTERGTCGRGAWEGLARRPAPARTREPRPAAARLPGVHEGQRLTCGSRRLSHSGTLSVRPRPGPARAHPGPHRKQLPPFLQALPRPGHVTLAQPFRSPHAGALTRGGGGAACWLRLERMDLTGALSRNGSHPRTPWAEVRCPVLSRPVLSWPFAPQLLLRAILSALL